MIRSFVVGAIVGGLAVWLWQDEVRAYMARKTRRARERAVHGLEVVESSADEVLDRAARPLRRAEEFLEQTRTKLGENLRAGQELIRPAPSTEGER
jgi:hypothetical protein